MSELKPVALKMRPELHRELKIVAAASETTVTALITEAIEKLLNERKQNES